MNIWGFMRFRTGCYCCTSVVVVASVAALAVCLIFVSPDRGAESAWL